MGSELLRSLLFVMKFAEKNLTGKEQSYRLKMDQIPGET
jgi:hypothetical protein